MLQISLYICDHFQFPCHLGSHIPSLGVDLVHAAISGIHTIVRLPMLGIFSVPADAVVDNCMLGWGETA